MSLLFVAGQIQPGDEIGQSPLGDNGLTDGIRKFDFLGAAIGDDDKAKARFFSVGKLVRLSFKA
ncbi:hypothetical protein [Methylomicrobium agile]|uniref:hypothetical protein n=1 Tax=Methylomicrobium agile TaxID=39774 RepID=UPI0014701CAF|nr:hypothetical protein [Methylomicrobium agile]